MKSFGSYDGADSNGYALPVRGTCSFRGRRSAGAAAPTRTPRPSFGSKIDPGPIGVGPGTRAGTRRSGSREVGRTNPRKTHSTPVIRPSWRHHLVFVPMGFAINRSSPRSRALNSPRSLNAKRTVSLVGSSYDDSHNTELLHYPSW